MHRVQGRTGVALNLAPKSWAPSLCVQSKVSGQWLPPAEGLGLGSQP